MLLCESVLAELSHELLNLIDLTEVKVWETKEYLIYFLLGEAMVQPEEELNFLNLLIKFLPTDKFGALK